MSASDTTFTLDPTQFLDALNSMTKKMDSMVQSSEKVAKATQEQTGSMGAAVVAKGVLLAQVVAGLAKKAFSFVMEGIPEIGQAFSIVGDIMKRNFLFPLRKELAPLLQGMLAWVRDHRAMFAQWGMYLVSVFRILKSVIVGFVEIIKNMWSKLSAGIERIFGKTTSTVQDIINLIIVKIAFLVEFAIILFDRLGSFIMKIFFDVLERWKAFTEGFIKGFGSLQPIVNDVINLFQRLSDMILGASGNSSTLLNIMRTLGAVLGTVVKAALLGIIDSLDSFITTLELVGLTKDKILGNLKEGEFTIKAQAINDAGNKRRSARGEELLKTGKESAGYIKDTWTGATPQAQGGTDKSTTNITVNAVSSKPEDIAKATKGALEKANQDKKNSGGNRTNTGKVGGNV
jgi:phage-related protein